MYHIEYDPFDTLYDPCVLNSIALIPFATLSRPIVFPFNAASPKAVFWNPYVLAANPEYPTTVLNEPSDHVARAFPEPPHPILIFRPGEFAALYEEIRTGVPFVLNLILPATSSDSVGQVVPIPTLPLERILIFSVVVSLAE